MITQWQQSGTDGNRRIAEGVRFTGSAVALWAICALGIYLIQPIEPEPAAPALLVSQALATTDLTGLSVQAESRVQR